MRYLKERYHSNRQPRGVGHRTIDPSDWPNHGGFVVVVVVVVVVQGSRTHCSQMISVNCMPPRPSGIASPATLPAAKARPEQAERDLRCADPAFDRGERDEQQRPCDDQTTTSELIQPIVCPPYGYRAWVQRLNHRSDPVVDPFSTLDSRHDRTLRLAPGRQQPRPQLLCRVARQCRCG